MRYSKIADEDTRLHTTPPARRADQDLLERLANAQIRVEKDVKRVEEKIDGVEAKFDDQIKDSKAKFDIQAVDLEKVSKTAHDLGIIKKIAAWSLGIIATYAGTAITAFFEDRSRIKQLEVNVQQYNNQYAQLILEIKSLRDRVEALAPNEADRIRTKALLERLEDELEFKKKRR